MTTGAARLFIAVDTPAQVKAAMIEVQRQLKGANADVKWEPADKLHATIKFLGNTKEGQVPAIAEALEKLGGLQRGLPVRYSRLGCFPNRRDPRVVWIGIDDVASTLHRLHEHCEAAMATLGFEREERAFHPHVTLGRVKGSRHIDILLGRMESVTFESQQVEIPEILLIRSDLQPGGSVYTVLKSFRLTA